MKFSAPLSITLLLASIELCSAEIVADPSIKLLESDLGRIVSSFELEDWFIDELAYEKALIEFMPSACLATDSVTLQLEEELSLLLSNSSDPKELFQAAQTLNDEVEEALVLRQKHKLIMLANKKRAHCPFWIKQQSPFKPRQSATGRFLFAAESGGMLQIKVDNDDPRTGGGGSARLLASYRYSQDFTLLGGFDFGGGAFVKPKRPEEDVDIRFFPALPLIFRFHFNAWHADLETAAVTTFSTDKLHPVPGWRLGGMVGFSTLRVRNLLPWAGLAIAVEQYPGSREEKGLFFRIGFRAGTVLME